MLCAREVSRITDPLDTIEATNAEPFPPESVPTSERRRDGGNLKQIRKGLPATPACAEKMRDAQGE